MNMQTKPPRTQAEQALLDSFAEKVGQLPGDAKVTIARDRLLSAITEAGLPTRRIESWHYTDLRSLLRGVPGKPGGAARALEPLVSGSVVWPVVQGEAANPSVPEGVELTPFMDLLASGEAAGMLAARGSDDLIGPAQARLCARRQLVKSYVRASRRERVRICMLELQSVILSRGQVHNLVLLAGCGARA